VFTSTCEVDKINVVITPRAERLFESVCFTAAEYVQRHRNGDWGEISPEDVEINKEGHGPLVSAYRLAGDMVILVVTIKDRSKTVVLVPSDFVQYRTLFE
jgi:hypothetical protein